MLNTCTRIAIKLQRVLKPNASLHLLNISSRRIILKNNIYIMSTTIHLSLNIMFLVHAHKYDYIYMHISVWCHCLVDSMGLPMEPFCWETPRVWCWKTTSLTVTAACGTLCPRVPRATLPASTVPGVHVQYPSLSFK